MTGHPCLLPACCLSLSTTDILGRMGCLCCSSGSYLCSAWQSSVGSDSLTKTFQYSASLHSGSTSLSALKIRWSQALLKLWPVWRRETSHLELSSWLVLHRGKTSDAGWRAWGTETGQQSVVRWDQSRWTEHSTARSSWGENEAKWPWGTSQHHEKCNRSSLTEHFLKVHSFVLSFGTPSFPFPGILVKEVSKNNCKFLIRLWLREVKTENVSHSVVSDSLQPHWL